jgi:hypothetical protein
MSFAVQSFSFSELKGTGGEAGSSKRVTSEREAPPS